MGLYWSFFPGTIPRQNEVKAKMSRLETSDKTLHWEMKDGDERRRKENEEERAEREGN